MTKPSAVKVFYMTSVLKACRNNHANFPKRGGGAISPLPTKSCQPPTPTTLSGPQFLTRTRLTAAEANSKNISPVSTGNPCHDLFFNIRRQPHRMNDGKRAPLYSPDYLNHLLPRAWSQSPLTTLKLICNLLESGVDAKDDKEGFLMAAYWLYQNHPMTLVSNLPSFASMGSLDNILELLYRALQGQDLRRTRNRMLKNKEKKHTISYPLFREVGKGIGGRASSVRKRDKVLEMANRALERYRIDPSYRSLHDGVADVFAQCLNHDIQNLNSWHEMNPHRSEITLAADDCPRIDSLYDRNTLLCESIARKVFPRALEEFECEEEEAEYGYTVRKRLREEVLVPLRRIFEEQYCNAKSNPWGYNRTFWREPCLVEEYLEEVKLGGECKINAGALLPNEILGYVVNKNKYNRNADEDDDGGLGAAAELQWKAMVEDMLKQGKFKNCLAVCHALVDTSGNPVVEALGMLVSELSEDPWKGKMIPFNENPKLLSIQGGDLKSKYEFIKSTEDLGELDSVVDLGKVFDLILQVAVDGNLKPEQMIKRLFVFTPWKLTKELENIDFEAIRSKFKEKGYGDVVPHIVHWKLHIPEAETVCRQPGFTMIPGFVNNDLVRSFLGNDGDIGPDHVMETAISGEKYQRLVVVD